MIRDSRRATPRWEKYCVTGLRSRSWTGDPSNPMLGAANVQVSSRTSRTSAGTPARMKERVEDGKSSASLRIPATSSYRVTTQVPSFSLKKTGASSRSRFSSGCRPGEPGVRKVVDMDSGESAGQWSAPAPAPRRDVGRL
ncbi:hypothetical protein GCM10020000_65070 [Streptomyces olivoverticillatus]